jgi:hypothetical protein
MEFWNIGKMFLAFGHKACRPERILQCWLIGKIRLEGKDQNGQFP